MLRASFGGPPLNCRAELKDHSKLFMFCALFAASIVWSSYRASLTSALVTRDLKVPFTTLEGFLDSDYRSSSIAIVLRDRSIPNIPSDLLLKEAPCRRMKCGTQRRVLYTTKYLRTVSILKVAPVGGNEIIIFFFRSTSWGGKKRRWSTLKRRSWTSSSMRTELPSTTSLRHSSPWTSGVRCSPPGRATPQTRWDLPSQSKVPSSNLSSINCLSSMKPDC